MSPSDNHRLRHSASENNFREKPFPICAALSNNPRTESRIVQACQSVSDLNAERQTFGIMGLHALMIDLRPCPNCFPLLKSFSARSDAYIRILPSLLKGGGDHRALSDRVRNDCLIVDSQ
jgi:hypothetical protein